MSDYFPNLEKPQNDVVENALAELASKKGCEVTDLQIISGDQARFASGQDTLEVLGWDSVVGDAFTALIRYAPGDSEFLIELL
ncbi:hypothetical protein HYV12_03325 [Candidatus Dojkabacteria bacterium]|nr:hypothetical protein [Candidatus Dojkabacteria bacterium]